jgi:hypothetical protein
VDDLLTMSGRHTGTMATLAVIFMDWGKTADAEAIYVELTARARREYVQPSYLALAAHALGLQQEVLAQIRRAVEIRDPYRNVAFSKYFPYGARLRSDNHCGNLLRRSGFD